MRFFKKGETRLVIPAFGNNVCKIIRPNFKEIAKVGLKEITDIALYKIQLAQRANLLEARINEDLRDFFAKTRLSIFGLINFQERLEIKSDIPKIGKLSGKTPPLIKKLIELSREETIFEASSIIEILHHLAPKNWGFDKNGNVKFCDSGGEAFLCFLKKHREKLKENLK